MTVKKPYKQKLYQEALTLRQRGFTYTQIAEICGISRGTVSNWLKDHSFSQRVALDNQKRAVRQNKERLKLVNKTRANERQRQLAEMVRHATVEFKNYQSSPLFMSALALYAGHADHKATNQVRFSSNQVELHLIFKRFLLKYAGVTNERLRLALQIPETANQERCRKYWAQKLGLKANQFYKIQLIPRGHTSRPLHFGTGNTIINDTLLQAKLQTWAKLTLQQLSKKSS